MSQSNGRPPHFPWLSPYLTVKDADAALEFYARAFGFEKREAMAGPDGRTSHAEMTYRDALVMFGPEGAGDCPVRSPASSGQPCPVNLYVYCPDVDALWARATAAGATPVSAPEDMFWGDRMCRLGDPSGHTWVFATYKGQTAPGAAG